MTPRLGSRKLVDANYATARSSIAFPLPHDVDLAPQLIAVTLAQAILAATHRAIDSAHPVLSLANIPGNCSALSDSEHYAMLVLDAGNELAQRLADYAAAVLQDNIDPHDDLPF